MTINRPWCGTRTALPPRQHVPCNQPAIPQRRALCFKFCCPWRTGFKFTRYYDRRSVRRHISLFRCREFDHFPDKSSKKPQIRPLDSFGRVFVRKSNNFHPPYCMGKQTAQYSTCYCSEHLRKCWSPRNIYILNLVLAQRILRARQPQIGWHRISGAAYKVLYVSIGLALARVIVAVVVALYTLDGHTRDICRDIELAALTYLLVITCLPVIHVFLSITLPANKDAEYFGRGSMKSKMIVSRISGLLCMLLAGFKAGATWSPPGSLRDPAWYDSKACFYVFNFTLEVLILSLLTFSRIDQRFFVPDGCNRAG